MGVSVLRGQGVGLPTVKVPFWPGVRSKIESKLRYQRWYCGHYHTEKRVDSLQFMFEDYATLPHELSPVTGERQAPCAP